MDTTRPPLIRPPQHVTDAYRRVYADLRNAGILAKLQPAIHADKLHWRLRAYACPNDKAAYTKFYDICIGNDFIEVSAPSYIVPNLTLQRSQIDQVVACVQSQMRAVRHDTTQIDEALYCSIFELLLERGVKCVKSDMIYFVLDDMNHVPILVEHEYVIVGHVERWKQYSCTFRVGLGDPNMIDELVAYLENLRAA